MFANLLYNIIIYNNANLHVVAQTATCLITAWPEEIYWLLLVNIRTNEHCSLRSVLIVGRKN